MKFTLSWLKEHLDTSYTLHGITDALTALGLEVEAVNDPAALYAPFKVVQVARVEKHPDADRLKICLVETQEGVKQVVCGAPNVRAGMKAVFAPDGAVIPSTGAVLKKGVIRGEESNGMLVSEAEMGLSNNHDGIIEVPDGVPLGTPFSSLYALKEPQIEIKLTPNRADCAGVRGVARDLAAAGHGTFRPLKYNGPVPGVFQSPINVHFNFSADTADACSVFFGRMIRGVKNGPSPQWLQDALTSIGQKPISALVDITNFMTMDLNRPLHVFDADKIKGDINVRLARTGEKLDALNDKMYTLADSMTVVCDGTGPLGLGGIIGGKSTGCSNGTVNVFIEAAYFNPLRTARTGRTLQVDSDARYRFERGIDPEFTYYGIEIATAMILDLCGGEASEIVTCGKVPEWQRTIPYHPSRALSLGGVDVAADVQKKILLDLGFQIDDSAQTWGVMPPSWRGDVEGTADIAEEIIRIVGFDKIPLYSVAEAAVHLRPAETLRGMYLRLARGVMCTRGLDECVTYSFMRRDHALLFGADRAGAGAADGLRIVNPISTDWDQMRPSMLPNLLLAAQRNADRGYPGAALFEVGPVFVTHKITGQFTVCGGVRYGRTGDKHWSGADAARNADVYDVKADALAVMQACAGVTVDKVMLTRDAPSWYHPGRSGVFRQGNMVLAHFGEIHPMILESLDIKGSVMAFEVFFDALPLPKNKGTARPPLKLSPFMPVYRDFAFVVDSGVEADAAIRAARFADRALITDVRVFDVYAGKGMEEGKKSIGITIELQPEDKTLTDAEIEAISQKVIDGVIAKTGGTLRA